MTEQASRYGIDYDALNARLLLEIADEPFVSDNSKRVDATYTPRYRTLQFRIFSPGQQDDVFIRVREYSVYPEDREPRVEYTLLVRRFHAVADRLDAIIRDVLPEAFWDLLERS